MPAASTLLHSFEISFFSSMITRQNLAVHPAAAHSITLIALPRRCGLGDFTRAELSAVSAVVHKRRRNIETAGQSFQAGMISSI